MIWAHLAQVLQDPRLARTSSGGGGSGGGGDYRDRSGSNGLSFARMKREVLHELHSLDSLLLIDNSDALLESGGRDALTSLQRFLTELLDHTRSLKVLLTSSRSVGRLTSNTESVFTLTPLANDQAARLLTARAPLRGLLLPLQQLQQHPLMECLGGNPYAISLCASLLSRRPPTGGVTGGGNACAVDQLHRLLTGNREPSVWLGTKSSHEDGENDSALQSRSAVAASSGGESEKDRIKVVEGIVEEIMYTIKWG
jgi:hypothetical protein